jgi:hypothetical protein
MINNPTEIQSLLSMFHDFEITLLNYVGKTLKIRCKIPWGELWGDPDYEIELVIRRSEYVVYEYYILQNQIQNGKEILEKKQIFDLNELTELRMSVQSYSFETPNNYKFFCTSHTGINGELLFTIESVIVLDNYGRPITVQKLKEAAAIWWNEIKDSWNDENGNDNS